ncbi:MAG TPA: hypothetical protein PLO50_03440 [Nitrospira sp.]|nr:hypothetical protein [Nitrospira sp.]
MTRPSTPVGYKECKISLTPQERADGTWTCRYSITKNEQRLLEPHQAQPEGAFPSREAAELEALQKAKALIDLNP